MRMFDIDDNDRIMELINKRKDGAYVMPLYIKLYNNRIDIRDIDEIDNFIPSAFKIGFGAKYGVMNKAQFPINYIMNFDIIKKFNHFDEKINNDVQCFVFESSEPYSNINHDIFEQMNYYYWIIRDYLENRMKKINEVKRKKLLEEMNNDNM